MKDFLIMGKSKLLLFVLLACFAGGVSPAWAETITDDFSTYTAPEDGATELGENWVIIGNDGTYSSFGSSKDYGYYNGYGDAYVYGNYASNYSKSNYLVLKKLVTGTVTFKVTNGNSSSALSVYVSKAIASGETYEVTGNPQSYSVPSRTSNQKEYTFDAGSEPTYVAFCLNGASKNLKLWSVTYTEADEIIPIEGPQFVVKDEGTAITSPFIYNFGLTPAGTSKKFTLSNPGTVDLPVSVSETGDFGATLSANTIAAGGEVTLTMTMPETSGSSVVTITPDAEGIEPFVINVSGTIRDENKIYETLSSKPDGWTTSGTWNFDSTNGATTTAWYSSNNSRLCTPLLTVANDEVFIFEAKGNYEDYQSLQFEYSADGTNWTASQTVIKLTSEFQSFTINDIPAGTYFIALHASRASIRNFYGGVKIPGANFAINIAEGATQDFGNVRFGATAEKSYTITNNGDRDLVVTFTDGADFFVPKTVKFTMPAGWSGVNFYVWDSSNSALNGSWPGDALTEHSTNGYGEEVYTATLPNGAAGIIFSDNGANQTSDISTEGFKYVIGYYLDNGNPVQWQNDDFTVAANSSASFTVKMDTKTSGAKSGNIVLAFAALNATSFTIPCTGSVKAENLLFVDFEDNTFPEGWQLGENWAISRASSNYYAVQNDTKTASALVTTPLTVADGETLTFKAARNASGYGYVTSLKTRYSIDGGATWSEYTNYSIEGSGLTAMTLTGVPAGTVIIEFFGCNVKIDDIEGFTKATKPALAVSEEGAAVANGDQKDFSYLNADGIATYTVKNIGNASLKAAVAGEGITVSPASIEVAAGETADITVTLKYEAPYGDRTGMKMTIDADDEWIGDFVVNFKANLVDPDAFVEDFTAGKPAGWYNGGWTFSNGVATVSMGTAKEMITKKLEAAEGRNVLSFKAKYNSEYLDQTINVYTSADRKNWSAAQSFTLTSAEQTYSLSALADGEYYVKFESANATVDDVQGLKNVALPEHDLFMVSATLPKDAITPIDTYTASVNVASLCADEDVTAVLYFGETKVATADKTIANGATEAITIAGAAPAAGDYEVYVKVVAGDITLETEKVTVAVADKTELTLTGFAAVAKSVQADENNEYTAEFNVTVKNTGSTAFAADKVSVTVTDGNNNDLQTATWTSGETIYLKAGDYTADNANLAIYRWSTDTDSEWALFTAAADGIYTASLNGKTNFIICRTNPEVAVGDLSFDNGVWNKSADLTATAGNVFENNGYQDNKLNMTQSNNLIAGMSATIKVAVSGDAGDGGEFRFNAKLGETYWYPGLGYLQDVTVTAAPTIVISEYGGSTFETGTNRKVSMSLQFVEGWNTICVPFALNATDIHSEAKALEFSAYDATANELTFSPVTELEANKPYVVYVPSTVTDTKQFTGKTVTASEELGVKWGDVTFQGTYAPVAAGDLTGKWGLTAEGKIVKAGESTTIRGFRAYFDGELSGATARFIGFDDTTTGINAIRVKAYAEGVYNLQGQKMEQLRKGGLYIFNGKKVVIK